MKMYVLMNDTDGTLQKELIVNINYGLKQRVKNPQLVNMGEQIGKELLALCLRIAIFEVVHRVLYILACRLHSELTIMSVHTVHKTLLNQFKVSSQRRLAQQSFCLLLLDTLANLLAHVH